MLHKFLKNAAKVANTGLLTALLTASLTACKTVPVDTNKGELLTSPGVQRYFSENENIGEIVVNDESDIRCERQRKTGTHMIVRVCRTKLEWKQLADQTRYQQERRLIGGACGDTRAAGLNRCSEGRPLGGG
ncbi:MAG: hypothetical protein AAF358_08990 [Pseudomonadota bacterium]